MKRYISLVVCLFCILLCFLSGCSAVEKTFDLSGSITVSSTKDTALNSWMDSISFELSGYYDESNDYLDAYLEYWGEDGLGKSKKLLHFKSIDNEIGIEKDGFIDWYGLYVSKNSVLDWVAIEDLKAEIDKSIVEDYILISDSEILFEDISEKKLNSFIVSLLRMLNIVDIQDIDNIVVKNNESYSRIQLYYDNNLSVNITSSIQLLLRDTKEIRGVSEGASISFDEAYHDIVTIKYKNNPVDFFEIDKYSKGDFLYADISMQMGTDIVQLKFIEIEDELYLDCETILKMTGSDYEIMDNVVSVSDIDLLGIIEDDVLYVKLLDFEKLGWKIEETNYVFFIIL